MLHATNNSTALCVHVQLFPLRSGRITLNANVEHATYVGGVECGAEDGPG